MKLWTLSIALLASCAHSPTSSQVAFPVGGAESTTSITKGSDPLPLLVAAGESGRSVGIDSYRIYRGQQLGGETLDVIDLLDKDNQFIGHNFKVKVLPESQEEVINTAKDIINSIAERDIYTGDNVEVVTVDRNGVRTIREAIRRD